MISLVGRPKLDKYKSPNAKSVRENKLAKTDVIIL